MTTAAWDELSQQIAELDTLAGIGGLLGWDQQVTMPSGSAGGRAQQSELIGRLYHEQATSARLGELIEAVAALPDSTPEQQAAVRNMRRTYRRATCVPSKLASRIAKASASGVAAWGEAKKEKNYGLFAESLQTNVDLALERAQAIDSNRHPYDVLLEDYDPGTTVEDLRRMFGALQQGLSDIRRQALARKESVAFNDYFDKATQLAMHQDIVKAVGYDTTRGALHEAEHPFSCRVGSGDVRIATHVHERDLLSGLAATMHELGHALYEQGIPEGQGGSAVYAATSTGMHESQSRLWENMIGRSRGFYRWLRPVFARHFPDKAFDPELVFLVSNRVTSGSIRIFAEEVSYNLHIIFRFEMEVALLERRITVEDVPAEWTRLSEQFLGVRPKDDAEGVLQDAHWAGGAFGYFPSYTLGNLYAASLFAVLRKSFPDLEHRIEEGDFVTILKFLRERIHRQGHLHETPDLLQKAVGTRDHVEDLLSYLRERYVDP
ncbi:carboxypeptidase M32 [Candidatus Nitrospira neomarina]|uniref:Metal-dependent carboxypeptidase n=1 Tax=Candidatus Nitrospira neomarina TaxID=3020899 RepID=A0AA96GMZ5_9BACT|nr:carboxypeptidase M32 [Candidatus Nitrospira neomarina]WNM61174.1 carboxypeptidase M32 [Candidatus Nitrospira neomarina]